MCCEWKHVDWRIYSLDQRRSVYQIQRQQKRFTWFKKSTQTLGTLLWYRGSSNISRKEQLKSFCRSRSFWSLLRVLFLYYLKTLNYFKICYENRFWDWKRKIDPNCALQSKYGQEHGWIHLNFYFGDFFNDFFGICPLPRTPRLQSISLKITYSLYHDCHNCGTSRITYDSFNCSQPQLKIPHGQKHFLHWAPKVLFL